MTERKRDAKYPETVDELVDWYARTHNAADIRMLVDAMLGKPHPFDHSSDPGVVEIPHLCNWIADFGLLYRDSNSAWVTREGKVYAAAYGAHERLLGWLGYECHAVEQLGWVRTRLMFGGSVSYQCLYRLSPAQSSWMKKNGIAVDRSYEITRPIWKAS